MCQQPGAAFTRSTAWLNTFLLLSYSVKFGSRCQKSLGFAPDAKLCEMWRGKERDKRNMEKNAAEIHAPLVSYLSNQSVSLHPSLHPSHFSDTTSTIRLHLCLCGNPDGLNKIFFFKEKPYAKHSDSRLSKRTEKICLAENNYFGVQFNKQSPLGCINVRLTRRQWQFSQKSKHLCGIKKVRTYDNGGNTVCIGIRIIKMLRLKRFMHLKDIWGFKCSSSFETHFQHK